MKIPLGFMFYSLNVNSQVDLTFTNQTGSTLYNFTYKEWKIDVLPARSSITWKVPDVLIYNQSEFYPKPTATSKVKKIQEPNSAIWVHNKEIITEGSVKIGIQLVETSMGFTKESSKYHKIKCIILDK